MILLVKGGKVGIIIDPINMNRATIGGFMNNLFGIDSRDRSFLELSWNKVTLPNTRYCNTIDLSTISTLRIYKEHVTYIAFRDGRDNDDACDICHTAVKWDRHTTAVIQIGINEPLLLKYLNNIIIENEDIDFEKLLGIAKDAVFRFTNDTATRAVYETTVSDLYHNLELFEVHSKIHDDMIIPRRTVLTPEISVTSITADTLMSV